MYSVANIPSEEWCKRYIFNLVLCYERSRGQVVSWHKKQDYIWCSTCNRKIRPRAISLFYNSKLTFRQIFCLIWHWQHRSSPGSVVRAMNISYPTIRRWYKRLRQYLPIDTLGKLSGVVEVDESYFGKKRYSNQVIVIGAIERDTKRLKLRMVANTEQPTLERFVLDNVEPGSLVMTDCHGGYNDLNFLGYNHEVWNHSRGHYAGTNQIEGTWSAMKRHMRKLYGNVPTDDMQLILNEWVARHNQPELFEDPRTYLKVVLLPS